MAQGDTFYKTWAGRVIVHSTIRAYNEFDKVRHTDGLVYRANAGGVAIGVVFVIGTGASEWTLMPRTVSTQFITTGDGTFTPDPDCIKTEVEAVAGGGGRLAASHSASTSCGSAMAGGSSGGYIKGTCDLPISVPTAFTIGNGGIGNGTNTVLTGYFTCNGGIGGKRMTNTANNHTTTNVHALLSTQHFLSTIGFTSYTVLNFPSYTGTSTSGNFDLQTIMWAEGGGSSPLGTGGGSVSVGLVESENRYVLGHPPSGFGSGASGAVSQRSSFSPAESGKNGIIIFTETLGDTSQIA